MNRNEYEDLLAAVGIAISVRPGVTPILISEPGVGKTSVLESLQEQGVKVVTLSLSMMEPSDIAGLPVIRDDGTVRFAPPDWALEIADHNGPALVFLDELTTCPVSTQHSALRALTHNSLGSTLRFSDNVSWAAAANPADINAGFELTSALANRLVFFDWVLPVDIYSESLIAGNWPKLPYHELPQTFTGALATQRALIAGYLRARQTQLCALPKDAAARGRAWPSPRSWDAASRLLALAQVTDANSEVKRLLVYGAVGAAAGHEFLSWADMQDLPDPEDLLATGASAVFDGLRPDRVFAVLGAVLAAVIANPTPDRWTAAIRVCADAADAGAIDAAVPVVRALVQDDVRPAGTPTPSEIVAFAPTLRLANLLPSPAA